MAKKCGIPQSRKRVFAIYIRKDIDTKKFEFPQPFDTGARLKDMLEENVDEKYYLPDEKVNTFLETYGEPSDIVSTRNNDFASCLRASYYKNGARNVEKNIVDGGVTRESLTPIPSNELEQIGYINNYNGDANRIYSDNIARTIKSEAGGGGAKTGWYLLDNNMPNKQVYLGNINGEKFGSGYSGATFDPSGVSPTLTTMQGGAATPHLV